MTHKIAPSKNKTTAASNEPKNILPSTRYASINITPAINPAIRNTNPGHA